MRYLILLLLSSLVACANRCSEEGGTGDEFMEPRGRWSEKVWTPLVSSFASRTVYLLGEFVDTYWVIVSVQQILLPNQTCM
jgi:hypothetical protein